MMKGSFYLVKYTLFLFLISCSSKSINQENLNFSNNRNLSAISDFNYRFFSSWDLAKADFNKKYGDAILKTDVDENYARVEKIATKVLNSYKKIFPELKTAIGSNALWVIIFDSDEFSAFASTTPSDESSDFYLSISKKVLESSDNAITGLMAHELTHILLQRNSTIEGRELPVNFYYDLSKVSLKKKLAGNTVVDIGLQKKMEIWEEYSVWVGENSTSFYKGVGLTHDFSLPVFLYVTYDYLMKKDCPKVHKSLVNIYNFDDWVGRNGGPKEVQKKLGKSDSLKIINQFGDAEDKIKKCLKDEKINIFAELRNYYIGTGKMEDTVTLEQFEEAANDKIESSLIKEFNKNALNWLKILPLKDAFFKIIYRARFKMRDIEKKINFNQIRRYTDEDHADELAVQILKDIKVPFDAYFLALGSIVPSQRICKVRPIEEPYSPINQKHHNQCWRYWRATQLE